MPGTPERDALADRFAAFKVSSREVLVDDADLGRRVGVAVGKPPTPHEWNSQRVEIACTDDVVVGERPVRAIRHRTPAISNGCRLPDPTAEGRDRAPPREREGPLPPGVRWTASSVDLAGHGGDQPSKRQSDLHRDDVVRPIARVDVVQGHQGADQQTGASHQQQRNRDFGDRQSLADAPDPIG